MTPITTEEILELIGNAERIEVVTEFERMEASWFTGSLDGLETDPLVIDNDDDLGCCVTLSDLEGAFRLEDGRLVLEDGREVILHGKTPDKEKSAEFAIIIGDDYCKYAYTLEASEDYSIDMLAQALAKAAKGKMSKGRLVELSLKECGLEP